MLTGIVSLALTAPIGGGGLADTGLAIDETVISLTLSLNHY